MQIGYIESMILCEAIRFSIAILDRPHEKASPTVKNLVHIVNLKICMCVPRILTILRQTLLNVQYFHVP